ncbi:MBL fold metallo-hydrolase [Methanobacterium spitsbergense]|uniref:MBL fold metallo-hydrolase n=1 Tax=Methanobacterium spitsbergense TaxID=2874285 RepID=A0A8T5UQ46_9EURY|nr:MBL fold metallo-hydrolase [Methanobacterium spitsbergense]MBZ2166112.1 MBL fold metallo-hydrolase [Methanobacterium spitsbergense]
MKIKEFKIKKSAQKSWSEIFQNPRDIILESFKTGSVKINRRGTINIKHPHAGYIKDQILNVPIISHLIKHNVFGNYLIDAGLDAMYTYDPYGGVKGKFADEFFQEKNENIGFHLKNNRIKLEGIFLSHLHPDHIAGVRELPKEIPYIVGKGEIEQYQPEIYGDFLKDIDTLYEIDFSILNEIPPWGPCADLLGDGSLWAISTPGHTKGHISYLINGLDGPILLTMDASFISDNLRLKIAPCDYTEDITLAQKTLEQICEFLLEYPEVKVLSGHELL